MSSLDLFLPLMKVDLDQRLVTGVATAETPDRSGEICDYASSKPYFEKWSAEALEASGGKSLGAVRAMHGRIAAGKLTGIDFDDEAKRIVVAAKIVDDDEWRKVTEGVYTGFSQGGRYVKRWPDPEFEPRPLHRRAARDLAGRPALPARRDLRGGQGRRGREARLRRSPDSRRDADAPRRARRDGKRRRPSTRPPPSSPRPRSGSSGRRRKTCACARRSTTFRRRSPISPSASPRSKPSRCPPRPRCARSPRAPTARRRRSAPTRRSAASPLCPPKRARSR